jgi:signal transduction histidine kinase
LGAATEPSAPAPAIAPAAEPEAYETEDDLLDAPAQHYQVAAPRSLRARAAVADQAAAPAEVPRQRRVDSVRVALDPMVGVATAEGALVLYRTVLVGQRGYRQGLVLDRAALGAWLEERVIRASGLARVAQVRFDGGARAAETSDRYVFAHRFAEPFDALHAQLLLASLSGVGSPGALYALVAVLLAVGAAGLAAVHRTVAVVMHYAERRSNFVAAVTHELKTPLTAIRMYAEMLRDGLVPSDAKRQEYYGTITDESERLSRLVDNVLEFSKLEGGRRELAIAVGAVGPVLEEAALKLATHAAREGFALRVHVARDLPAVRFDRDALLQVLFNLVDNAMKYAKTGGQRTVELEAHREGDAVTVAVRDFGPGVARLHLERVFEPFYRAESELTRTTKGTGIGLALVKELAERMGAAVSGANADGGGFRVRLAFPVAG